jgi:glucosamine--fructose-6-phosphate aminotransferase (isomerizing)
MCGIIGVISSENDVSKIIVDNLKKLEYRGYDSAGIAIQNQKGIIVKKEVGRIDIVNKKLRLSSISGSLGIGHTRWATCGGVTKENSHPHTDCKGNIALVHNGIIENFQELKEKLHKNGHTFTSETDSEVLAHMIEDEVKKRSSLRDAILNILPKLTGRYALVVMDSKSNSLIGVRNGSPLTLGLGDQKKFISSDLQTFLDYTNEAVVMHDGELAEVGDEIHLFDINSRKKKKFQIQTIYRKIVRAELGKFPHYMLKEIYEQPDTLKKTFDHVGQELKKLRMKPLHRIVIIACGTAYYAGLVGSYYFEKFLKFPADVQYASEFRYRDAIVDDKTLVIAISQSGETADTLAAVDKARAKGAFVLSICNVAHSTLVRESNFTLTTQAGQEVGVASTKAFTAQVQTLLMFCMYYAKHKEGYNREKGVMEMQEVASLGGNVKEVLKGYDSIVKVASKYSTHNNVLFLGRGYLYPIALEGALKLKEISYIHAEGQSAAELKHGPIALIDKDMPSVFLALKDDLYDKVLNNMQEVKSRGGKIIAIATEGDKGILKVADDVIYVPKMSDYVSPIVSVVVLQVFAYVIALQRGCDIDKPRNLAKVVTVE